MEGWFENMVRMEQMPVILFSGLKIGLTKQKTKHDIESSIIFLLGMTPGN